MGFLDAACREPQAWDLTGKVLANQPVSGGLWRLDLALPHEVPCAPGQFAMLHPYERAQLVFRRPYSILAAQDATMSFLYRVVGRGSSLLAGLSRGEPVACLAPLGRPFAAPNAQTPAVLLLAGGVGLPPLHAWLERYGRPGDLPCFGGRDGGDVPWPLLPPPWHVAVERLSGVPSDREVFQGLVTDLALRQLAAAAAREHLVLACGPTPLLRAAAALAAERGWPCLVSVEEHMGCGYGVCKGCVVPLRDPSSPAGWRNVNTCTDGPVFAAGDLDWDRFGSRQGGGAS